MTRVKVAIIHNRYQQPGGEDAVFAAEAALLRAHAHEVVPFCLDNTTIERMGRIPLARASVWNSGVHD